MVATVWAAFQFLNIAWPRDFRRPAARRDKADRDISDLQHIIDDELGGHVTFREGIVDWQAVDDSGEPPLSHRGRDEDRVALWNR